MKQSSLRRWFASPASRAAMAAPRALWRASKACWRWGLGRSPVRIWLGNAAALVLATGLVFGDSQLHRSLGDGPVSGIFRGETPGAMALTGACGFAAVSLLLLVLGLCFGPAAYRQVRSLAVLVLLLSLWLGFAVNFQQIAFGGRSWRLASYVAEFQVRAAPLQDAWPSADGELVAIGPFMAYPVGRPSTLILLTPPEMFAGGPAVAAIERADDGAIRFELSDCPGDWLEWRPSGVPASHVGGLLEQRRVERFRALGKGWYLVHYDDSGDVAQSWVWSAL